MRRSTKTRASSRSINWCASGSPALPGVVSDVYVRRQDGPLGIEFAPDTVTVPAYLATPEGTSFVSASVPQGAVLVVPPGQSIRLLDLPLPAGTWTLTGDADGARYTPQKPSNSVAGDTAWLVDNPTTRPLIFHQFSLHRQQP